MGANAQTSVPAFVSGQVLTAEQQTWINTGVPVFATTTTRDAAFGGTGEKTLAEGQTCYIETAPNRLQVYDGSVWLDLDFEYQSFTPSFTNFTLGNGTASAVYCRLGKFVHYTGQVQLGSTSSMGSLPTISLPVNHSMTGVQNMGIGFCEDASPSAYFSAIFYAVTASTVQLAVQDVSTWVKGTFVSATAPFTWTTNDRFQWNIYYRSA